MSTFKEKNKIRQGQFRDAAATIKARIATILEGTEEEALVLDTLEIFIQLFLSVADCHLTARELLYLRAEYVKFNAHLGREGCIALIEAADRWMASLDE